MKGKKIYAGAAASLLLLFFACKMMEPESGADPGSDGKAAVRIGIEAAGVQGRTILPSVALSDVTAWELWGGKSTETKTKLADFSGISTTVYLETGAWDFTLKGYTNGALILQETITSQAVTLEGPNNLEFAVEPVLEGSGTFRITINLPDGHGITAAKVLKDGNQVDEVTPAGNAIIFEESFPAGDYYFIFELYKDRELYGVVSEMAQVRANLRSEKTYTLNRQDLNITYIITYDTQEGQFEIGVPNPGYYRSTDAAFTLPAPARTGYTFGGWYGDRNFNGNAVTEIPQGSSGNTDFYARWQANTYRVEYNPNSGTGTMEPSAHTYDQYGDLNANYFSRTGYTFGEWNTQADGSGTSYAGGENVTNLSADDGVTVTLYAQWTPNTYRVEYNPNGGTGTTASSSHIYDQAQALTANGFSMAGYTFGGWNTQADGSGTSYANSQNVTNLSADDGAAVILYVQWVVGITFDSHGGSEVEAITANEGTQVPRPGNPARVGYTFKGWYNAETGGAPYTWPYTLTVNVTMHAQWTAHTYSVVYNSNRGTGTTASSYHTYDQSRILTANGFSMTGYTFSEWNTRADGSGTSYANSQSVTNLSADNDGTVNLYAQWTPITYRVEYNSNGGTGTMASSSHTYDQTKALTANGFSRTGYVFAGWNTQADGSGTSYANGQEVLNLSATNGAAVSLYALWVYEQFVITLNLDAGTGAFSQTSFSISRGGSEIQAVSITGSGYTNPRWEVDGEPKGTGNSITIQAADYRVGKHSLTLIISKSGISWSKELSFTVTD
ncbi:hypothetical protein Holit_03168 [Hollandina sp. SP2]